MPKNNFVKNLIMHIRYPWTAICLLILWLGTAIMCAVIHFSPEDVILLISLAGAATVTIALVGFRA